MPKIVLIIIAVLTGMVIMASCYYSAPIAVAPVPVQSAASYYTPSSYGEAGHCYYRYYPEEAQNLINAGLCPQNWVPYPMPLAWYHTYYWYYSSPAFYGLYVPSAYRSTYISQTTTYYNSNQRNVSDASRNAQYKDDKGNTVRGSDVENNVKAGKSNATAPSSGNARSSAPSSGNARDSAPASGNARPNNSSSQSAPAAKPAEAPKPPASAPSSGNARPSNPAPAAAPPSSGNARPSGGGSAPSSGSRPSSGSSSSPSSGSRR